MNAGFRVTEFLRKTVIDEEDQVPFGLLIPDGEIFRFNVPVQKIMRVHVLNAAKL